MIINKVTSSSESQVSIIVDDPPETTEVIFCRNPRYPQYVSVMAVAIGALSLGTVLGWSSPAISSLLESKHFHNLTTPDLSLIGSIIMIGAVPGSLVGGLCIEKLGRKSTLILSAIPLALGWLSISTATQIWMLRFGRLFTGFGIGALVAAAPLYLSEILQPDIRGQLVLVFCVVVKVGIFLTFHIGSFLPYDHLGAVCTPIPIIFGVAVAFLPESPRFLLTKGDTKAATDALCWFRGARTTHPTEDVTQEITEMLSEINAKAIVKEEVRLIHLLTSRPVLIVLGLMFFNQFCAGNYFGFYTVMIFEETGSGLDSHLSGVIVGLFQFIAAIATTLTVDTVGRRLLLFWGFVVMLFSLATLAAYSFLKSANIVNGEVYNWIPLVSLIVYNAAYNGGVSGLVWTVMSEILPGHVIGPASGLASTLSWTLAFVTTRYFIDLNEALGQQNTFCVFALFCGLGAIFIYTFVPETKLKSLTKIQHDNFDKREEK